MFCPNCATQNLDGAKFCRSCGVNVSLIPQALSGHLPQAAPDHLEDYGRGRHRRGRGEPSLDGAFRNAFMGIAFLLVALALSFSRMGMGWWFWMLIPAFSMMGTGIAQYIRLKEREKRTFQPGNFSQPSIQSPLNPQMQVGAFTARNTGEMLPPPPSVTEGTTRHLGAEAPTRHFDGPGEAPE